MPASRLVPSSTPAARRARAGRAVFDRHARRPSDRGHRPPTRCSCWAAAALARAPLLRRPRAARASSALDLDEQKLAQARTWAPRTWSTAGPDVAGQVHALTGRRRSVGRHRGRRDRRDLSAGAGPGRPLRAHRVHRVAEGRRAARGPAHRAEGSGDPRIAERDRRAVGRRRDVRVGRVDPRPLVTHRVALDAVPAMFEQWAAAPAASARFSSPSAATSRRVDGRRRLGSGRAVVERSLSGVK